MATLLRPRDRAGSRLRPAPSARVPAQVAGRPPEVARPPAPRPDSTPRLHPIQRAAVAVSAPVRRLWGGPTRGLGDAVGVGMSQSARRRRANATSESRTRRVVIRHSEEELARVAALAAEHG